MLLGNGMKPIFIFPILLASFAYGQKLSSHVVMPKAGKTASVIVQYRSVEDAEFNAKVRSLGRAVKQAHPELGMVSMVYSVTLLPILISGHGEKPTHNADSVIGAT